MNVIVVIGKGLDIKYLTMNKNYDIIKYKGSKAPFDLIFPLWLCELLKPREYKIDKEYGGGYYGHYYGYPIYYVPIVFKV